MYPISDLNYDDDSHITLKLYLTTVTHAGDYTGGDLQFSEIRCLSNEGITESPLKTVVLNMGMR